MYTSNLSLDDLRYDDRITNRIKERTFQLPFPEESVRGTDSREEPESAYRRNEREMIDYGKTQCTVCRWDIRGAAVSPH